MTIGHSHDCKHETPQQLQVKLPRGPRTNKLTSPSIVPDTKVTNVTKPETLTPQLRNRKTEYS